MADTAEKPQETTSTASAADEDEEDLFKADDDDGNEDEEEGHDKAQEPGDQPPGETEVTETDAAEHTQESAVEQLTSTTDQDSGVDAKVVAPLSSDVPIPRISAPVPTASPTSKPNMGGKYGLPPDIVIPPTVTPQLLQGRLLETLRALPKQLINDALVEYDDAVQIKGESIRNHGAYLYGVVKRYISVQERAASGEGEGILPMGPELTPRVNERLEKLVRDQFCTEEEMNEKVKSKIRMLSEKDALFAIEELASVDRSQIRNFGSYFMGILNRYMRGERKDVTSGKKTLAEVRQSFQSPHTNRNEERTRDERFSRGRDSEPQYRRARDDSIRRERSRDRHDAGGRRGSQDFMDPYDARNQQPQQVPPYNSGQPLMGATPPPPPPRPHVMHGGTNPYQPQPPYAQNPPPMQNQYGHQPPLMNQVSNPPYGQQPPVTQYGSQQMQMQRGPMFGGPPVPNQQYGQPQNLVSQENPYLNPQHVAGSGIPQMPGNTSNSYGMTANQQMPPYMNQLQQLPQQQSYSNSPYSPQPSAPANRFNEPGGPPNRWGNQGQNPPQSPGTVDIMALADKASSAVQALQNQNKFQMPPSQSVGYPPLSQPQNPMNPYQPNVPPQTYGQPQLGAPPSYPPMNQPYQPIPQQPDQAIGGQKMRRRTTANIAELPMTVQYAVQNLQATGHINGPLDDGMLGMVKDLPENHALQALQKFSTLDKSSMRNKTAYLAGLLRRELEKIHRR